MHMLAICRSSNGLHFDFADVILRGFSHPLVSFSHLVLQFGFSFFVVFRAHASDNFYSALNIPWM